jgi:FkbM family methyltransferase
MSMTPHTFQSFNQLKACRHGQMLYNINDRYIGRSFELYGEFSEGEVALFRQAVQPGHVVLEIGANIGGHTLFLARQVAPYGRVIAFEPQRIVFQTLCANMALNNVLNVWCRPEAVGAEPGMLLVPSIDYLRFNNFGGLSLEGWPQGDPVNVVTIDSLNLPACNFIKIDVEGMEEAVLRGAVQTIQRFRPLLYVENDRKDRSASLIRFIDSLDYAQYWHHPPLYNPANFLGNTHNEFGTIVSMNMLCLHRSTSIKMEGFPPVEVPKTVS